MSKQWCEPSSCDVGGTETHLLLPCKLGSLKREDFTALFHDRRCFHSRRLRFPRKTGQQGCITGVVTVAEARTWLSTCTALPCEAGL